MQPQTLITLLFRDISAITAPCMSCGRKDIAMCEPSPAFLIFAGLSAAAGERFLPRGGWDISNWLHHTIRPPAPQTTAFNTFQVVGWYTWSSGARASYISRCSGWPATLLGIPQRQQLPWTWVINKIRKQLKYKCQQIKRLSVISFLSVLKDFLQRLNWWWRVVRKVCEVMWNQIFQKQWTQKP